MQKRTLIILLCASVFAFAGIIELIHPAPKLSDFCQQPSCRLAVQDVLSVKSEDYRGGLMLFYLICLGISALGSVIAFFIKRPQPIVLLSLFLISNSIVNIILLRFLTPFTWWPTQTWTVIALVLGLSSTIMVVSAKRTSS